MLQSPTTGVIEQVAVAVKAYDVGMGRNDAVADPFLDGVRTIEHRSFRDPDWLADLKTEAEEDMEFGAYIQALERQVSLQSDRLAALEAFVAGCVVVGSGATVADPIRVEGPADGRWERVKPNDEPVDDHPANG